MQSRDEASEDVAGDARELLVLARDMENSAYPFGRDGLDWSDEVALLRRAALALSQRADGWVACSERLPDAGEIVLGWYGGSPGSLQMRPVKRADSAIRKGGSVWGLNGESFYDPTHWRPLPAPPEQEATR